MPIYLSNITVVILREGKHKEQHWKIVAYRAVARRGADFVATSVPANLEDTAILLTTRIALNQLAALQTNWLHLILARREQ